MPNKYEHVRRAPQSRRHTCHWTGCPKQVPPAMWGCKEHWFRVPQAIRDEIWKAYEAGQEESMTPSQAYLDAAEKAEKWIASQLTKKAK